MSQGRKTQEQIHIRCSTETKVHLQDLKDRMDASSYADVLRRSLALMEIAWTAREQGSDEVNVKTVML